MKRRQFIKSLAAAAAAPMMPLKLAARPLPVSPELYAKAAHWAGLWVHSTPTTYQNVLGVEHSVGKAVFERLQADGILGAVDSCGIARAVTPYHEIPEVAARIKKAIRPATGRGPVVKSVEVDGPRLRKIAKAVTEEPEGEPLETVARPEPRPDRCI